MHQSLSDLIIDYEKAVSLGKADSGIYHHLGMYYFKNKVYVKAINHFKMALNMDPSFLLAHYHLGLLYLNQEDFSLAKLRFLSVLDLDENHLNSHFYLGCIFLKQDDLQQAEWHFQAVLNLDAQNIEALVNLGALALKREQGQLAIHYFTQALLFDNDHEIARRNLAATFLHYHRFENALTHYLELEKKQKLLLEDWYNMGVAFMSLDRLSEAADYYHCILNALPHHLGAKSNLAAIYIRQGKRFDAINLLESLLLDYPEDEASRFMLTVLQEKEIQPKESQVYIKNLFNNYAINFDYHLKKGLNYNLPEKSIELLKKLNYKSFNRVLDLGCGTGLSGVLLKEMACYLIGVDISENMLKQAKLKACYDEVVEDDILHFLKTNSTNFDLIQALEVLPYFGDLRELFLIISARLNILGLFLISIEISSDASWKIQKSMRFCHHIDYVLSLADSCGLNLFYKELIHSRYENKQPLAEMVLIFIKNENR